MGITVIEVYSDELVLSWLEDFEVGFVIVFKLTSRQLPMQSNHSQHIQSIAIRILLLR